MFQGLPPRTPPSEDVLHLKLRFSPGFTAVVRGEVTPLRFLSQFDGFGRLGLYVVFSPHLGAEALRPFVDDLTVEGDPARADPLVLAEQPDRFLWAILTEPLHDARDRAELAMTTVAVNPSRGQEETAAAVRAGILRYTGRKSRDHAPLFDILNIDTWTKYTPPR